MNTKLFRLSNILLVGAPLVFINSCSTTYKPNKNNVNQLPNISSDWNNKMDSLWIKSLVNGVTITKLSISLINKLKSS